jgi:hypothetical protein
VFITTRSKTGKSPRHFNLHIVRSRRLHRLFLITRCCHIYSFRQHLKITILTVTSAPDSSGVLHNTAGFSRRIITGKIVDTRVLEFSVLVLSRATKLSPTHRGEFHNFEDPERERQIDNHHHEEHQDEDIKTPLSPSINSNPEVISATETVAGVRTVSPGVGWIGGGRFTCLHSETS